MVSGRFFDIMDDERAQPDTARFTYRRAAFFNTFKGKTGLMVARAAALRININTDGVCASHLLTASCAPRFHLPVTACKDQI